MDDLIDDCMDDLRNVQNIIVVTQNNIDALNTKFANLKNTPELILTEVQVSPVGHKWIAHTQSCNILAHIVHIGSVDSLL